MNPSNYKLMHELRFDIVQLKFHLGDVVRKLREGKRWNQSKLAAAAQINKATVVRVEENAPGIKRETYESIAKAFEMTIGELFSLVPEETQRASASAEDPFRSPHGKTGTK